MKCFAGLSKMHFYQLLLARACSGDNEFNRKCWHRALHLEYININPTHSFFLPLSGLSAVLSCFLRRVIKVVLMGLGGHSKTGVHSWRGNTGRYYGLLPHTNKYPKILAFHGPKLGNDFGALLHRASIMLLLVHWQRCSVQYNFRRNPAYSVHTV